MATQSDTELQKQSDLIKSLTLVVAKPLAKKYAANPPEEELKGGENG